MTSPKYFAISSSLKDQKISRRSTPSDEYIATDPHRASGGERRAGAALWSPTATNPHRASRGEHDDPDAHRVRCEDKPLSDSRIRIHHDRSTQSQWTRARYSSECSRDQNPHGQIARRLCQAADPAAHRPSESEMRTRAAPWPSEGVNRPPKYAISQKQCFKGLRFFVQKYGDFSLSRD
eukprot:g14057.t1